MSDLFTARTHTDVRECLKRCEDINLRRDGETPFIYHCKENNIEVVMALIRYGCDISLQDWFGRDGITWICSKGNISLLKCLIVCPFYPDISPRYNDLLILVASVGHMDIFDFLIKNNADPNSHNIRGITPLINACKSDCIDMVFKLLNLGVNINYTDGDWKTALFYCKSLGVLNHLINYGIDYNKQNYIGKTALMFWIYNNYPIEVIEYLVAYGCNLDLRDNYGKTSLMYAADEENIDICKLLLKHGADINIKDDNNNTAYDYAVLCDNKLLQEILS